MDCGAGATINVSVAVNGGAPQYYNYLAFNENIPGTVSTLPRSPNYPLTIMSQCSDANYYNDWGSWDFPIPEGVCPDGGTIEITVISANDCVFQAGCGNFYPANTNTIITPADCPCNPEYPGADNDGDGWGDCDCDDNDPNINPGATEIPYDGIDNDCDAGTLDDDLDGDGYPLAQDCDDNNPDVYPGAPSLCGGLDYDCDGIVSSSIGYSITSADINLVYQCGTTNLYNDCYNDIQIQWTSTGNGMSSGYISFDIGVECSGNTSKTVFLNGVSQGTINPTPWCSCSLNPQSFSIALNPQDYNSNGVNVVTIQADYSCLGLSELAQYGTGVFARVCVDYCDDPDGDGVCGADDNCPDTANADQADADGDGQGDACDACPYDFDNDIDGDGVCGDVDNCPDTANADQADTDGDGQGDMCDSCPLDANNDIDGDGVCGDVDNCPDTANADQADADCDGVGDVCDVCPNGDDTYDNNGDGIPDCSQVLGENGYSSDWQCSNPNNPNEKILVCHFTNSDSNPMVELCVSINAVPTHLADGDVVGPCTYCTVNLGIDPTVAKSAIHEKEIQEEIVSAIHVYPNPANNQINIRLNMTQDENAQLTIYNKLGQPMVQSNLEEGQRDVQLDLNSNNFKAGVYIISIKVGDKVYIERFIKTEF